jgi:glycosyltransferase involved in cell wall biosynthesis
VSGRRLLHVVHDFLPRHRAGVEIYTAALCRELARRHQVTILTTDYDPLAAHGELSWRLYDGVPVVEIRNNWEGGMFEASYRPGTINARIEQVLDTVQPHVVHVHNLLNLSLDLPALARRRGIKVVATLHDYTLVCPSGGQRLHRAESHVCHDIDVHRCARCFPETVFQTKLTVGRMMQPGGGVIRRLASSLHRRVPRVTKALAERVTEVAPVSVEANDVARRLEVARTAMANMDLLVAPSASIAAEFARLGAISDRIRVADYGFEVVSPGRSNYASADKALRVGYVGSLVWHKGVHVLLAALPQLRLAQVELLVDVHGDPALDPEYAKSLRDSAAGTSVHFRGPFQPAQRAEVYANLDVLVVPSLWLENSPLVIHEALLAGVAVIGSNIGGIPGLIQHEVNGLLVPPGSVDALAAALRRLANDRELLDRLRRVPHQIKSIADDAAEWEQRYEEVMAERLTH